MKQVLHIKNMVCNRCIKVVKEELEKLDIQIEAIELGKVDIPESLTQEQTEEVRSVLNDNGFELIDDKKSQLIDRIKTIIIEKIHYSKEEKEPVNFSDVIASDVSHDYSYISKLFSSVEGITIEKYIINQKIEKVKELLVYGELTLNEISYQLGYSSVQHLSNQFKKVTGLTPSHFKKLKENKRKPLDEV
ncbi:helix-turn-helix domain-containing protein [uncultured Draconibacterium sp.]|uniref:helix-turn-helix domain-containing protein n=1 Tax=uncultured Draconibacterium sp. TaxID=1573823 RepID=UPI002AA6643D|nr:helix-turn-helix domain-containing protein [uncultured Draconibacterium sp.]